MVSGFPVKTSFRELRQTLKDYEQTLEAVMSKHRMLTACFLRQPVTPVPTPDSVRQKF